MDRAHRIGQAKAVNVYRLIATDSIDERIMALHDTKMAMANAIVNSENSSLHSMGTERLLDIFRFRSDRSGEKDMGVKDDIDSIIERYEEEYNSLSLDEFLGAFTTASRTDNQSK